MSASILAQADRLASDVLAPAAGQVDQSGVIPASHLDALAEAGLYGAVTGVDPAQFGLVIETLAEGCLSTTFVWLQHHGLVGRTAFSPGDVEVLSAEFLGQLEAGTVRAGIVQAGLLPGEPVLTASPQADGSWLLSGFSPWCTGWGMVSELLVAARHSDDPAVVVWFLVPAADTGQLTSTRLGLQAVDATETVSLQFADLAVGPERCLGTDDYAVVGHGAGTGLRPNGSLALGLAKRCVAGMEAIGGRDAELVAARAWRLRQRIDDVRLQLDRAAGLAEPAGGKGVADPSTMAAARADANELAVEAAVAFVAASGARAALAGSEAERAMREATFLLVFGSRPQIKAELLSPQ